MDPNEVRERRRAKILASKDARMSRITGAHKEDSTESLEVDEIVLQEFIAEGKKQAVELAKEDYSRTHLEHETEADELLTDTQIKERQNAQFKQKLQALHEAQNNGVVLDSDARLAVAVVIVSAVSAASFFFKRTSENLRHCLQHAGLETFKQISTCRRELLPIFLQTVPGTFAVALLPILSELFKGRQARTKTIASILPRTILFLVVFIITLQTLIRFN
jgi:hypothetical protein